MDITDEYVDKEEAYSNNGNVKRIIAQLQNDCRFLQSQFDDVRGKSIQHLYIYPIFRTNGRTGTAVATNHF